MFTVVAASSSLTYQTHINMPPTVIPSVVALTSVAPSEEPPCQVYASLGNEDPEKMPQTTALGHRYEALRDIFGIGIWEGGWKEGKDCAV